jgi:spermidine synthase
MGGSLPVLSKALLQFVPRIGKTVGALYAINTLGAAMGSVLVDAWLILNLGMLRSTIIAATGNIVVALAICGLMWRQQYRAPAPLAKVRAERILSGLGPRQVLAIYAISGFCALAYEVVWTRILLNHVFSSRFAISTMLAVVLLGLVVGSALATRLLRDGLRGSTGILTVQILLGVTALVGFYGLESWSPRLHAIGLNWSRAIAGVTPLHMNFVATAVCLPHALALEFVPCILLGAMLPLVAQAAVGSVATAGRSVGLIYLSNTLGAIGGAILAGFILLPRIGSEGTLQILAALNILLGLGIAMRMGGPRRRAAIGVTAFCTLLLLIVSPKDWAIQRREGIGRETFLPGVEAKTLYLADGLYATISVREHSMLQIPFERRLMTNSYSMSGTGQLSNRYMRLMAHIPLLLIDEPENAALIAFGIGNTARALASHPLRHIDAIDIADEAFQVAPYFAKANRDVLHDPRVTTHVNDGRNYLHGTTRHYDLITFEPPPPVQADVVSLYTTEYYKLVRSCLTDRGMMTQWLPIAQALYSTDLSMVKSVLEVFPHVTLWTGAMGELILCASASPMSLNVANIDRRIGERRLDAELKEIGIGDGSAILATFLGDEQWLRTLTASVEEVTDDNRLLEYDYARRGAEPSDVEAYLAFFRSGQYVSGVDSLTQDEMRQLCAFRWEYVVGKVGNVGTLDDLPRWLRRSDLCYLFDATFGVPAELQAEVERAVASGAVLEDRLATTKASWHYLARDQQERAEGLIDAGLRKWPFDTELRRLQMIERSRHTGGASAGDHEGRDGAGPTPPPDVLRDLLNEQ